MSRTFCLHNDLERIFSMGLAKGGSLENAIVVSGSAYFSVIYRQQQSPLFH